MKIMEKILIYFFGALDYFTRCGYDGIVTFYCYFGGQDEPKNNRRTNKGNNR